MDNVEKPLTSWWAPHVFYSDIGFSTQNSTGQVKHWEQYGNYLGNNYNSFTTHFQVKRQKKKMNADPVASSNSHSQLDEQISQLMQRKPLSEQEGGGVFSGFTRLCKGLAVVLVGVYALLQIFPPALSYLALIPAWTIPFVWNLITAGYIEQSLWEVIVSIVGLLFIGKLLEPIWGPREFLKFIFVVNFLTSVCIFITAITLYYITRQESFLYTPLSGFHGILLGFLVGIKQIIPDQELGVLKIKVKWIPSLVVLVSIAISFFRAESASYLPTLIFGTYMSWIYLRYLQRKPETNLKGDPSDEFAFSTFFPEFLRPIIDPIASIFDRMLCSRSEIFNEARGNTLGATPLPGSDPIEASRRRERGARALEERLAAEVSAVGSAKDPSRRDAAENV